MTGDGVAIERGRSSTPASAPSKWRFLVVLPALELPVAVLALLSSAAVGPSHAVTASLAIFLMYATPVVGPLSFAGLYLDGSRRTATSGRRERGDRWWLYALVALAFAAVLTYHASGGTEGNAALFGLWEPSVALALAMVPVGVANFLRRYAF
ncbi:MULTISPECIES: hypothetical protein [Halorussus]|uniref:hypothetical protein n=1 Tax=Halorussus TaxID=1070314 RepID=UPI00209E704B|nr:hypothetical protein [Halorussus vallis]USZ75493.1 hypothetical protein NGM07_18930 [Halorussus vallis]